MGALALSAPAASVGMGAGVVVSAEAEVGEAAAFFDSLMRRASSWTSRTCFDVLV